MQISDVKPKLAVYADSHLALCEGMASGVGGKYLLEGADTETASVAFCAGSGVMVAKSFVMLVLATLLGPALGVGLFVLLHTL